MKPKYLLTTFRNLDGYFVIKRISGGYISGGMTITKYEVVYPKDLDNNTRWFLGFQIKGNGTSVKNTIFRKEKFSDSLRGVIKQLFEEN